MLSVSLTISIVKKCYFVWSSFYSLGFQDAKRSFL